MHNAYMVLFPLSMVLFSTRLILYTRGHRVQIPHGFISPQMILFSPRFTLDCASQTNIK